MINALRLISKFQFKKQANYNITTSLTTSNKQAEFSLLIAPAHIRTDLIALNPKS